MLGRKKKREIEKDESEENGLHKNESLLEYKNKNLCTLINDLRTKLKSKEESYASLESKFNSIISFFNLFTSSINTLNQEITSALSKNKISIKESVISKEKKNIFSSPSEFIQNLIKNEKKEKLEKQEKNDKHPNKDHNQSQTSLINSSLNNKIIVDDEEDEEMKDVTEKENEYEQIGRAHV